MLRGNSETSELLETLSNKLSRFIPPSIDTDKEIREYLSADLSILGFDHKKDATSVCKFWADENIKQKFPGLHSVAMAALSVFHGPAVESSFSVMSNIMDKHKGQMDIEAYDAYMRVKYYLINQKKLTTELYNPRLVQKQIDLPLCASIWQASARYKAAKKKKANDAAVRRITYGVQPVSSAKSAGDLEKDKVEKDRAKQRKRRNLQALKELVAKRSRK